MHTVCVQRVSKDLFIRPLRWKHAVYLLPDCDVYFFTIRTQIVIFVHAWTVRRLCMTGTNLDQRKHNEYWAYVRILVPSVRLTLVWRSSGVYIHTWKNAHIFQHEENVRRGWHKEKMNNVHPGFSSNHQRIVKHAERITTRWPKFFIFWCAGPAWWYVWLGL